MLQSEDLADLVDRFEVGIGFQACFGQGVMKL